MSNAIADRFVEPSVIESPYAYFDDVRKAAPVYFSEITKSYFVTSFDLADEVLRAPDIYRNLIGGEGVSQANFDKKYQSVYDELGVPMILPTLQATDGDLHRRYRQASDETFTAAAVNAMQGDIQARIDKLIDAFINDGRADIYSQFCVPLPLYVMCDLIGLPHELTPVLQASANAMSQLAVPSLNNEEQRVALHRDQASFNKAVFEIVKQKRAKPDDTLMSRLIQMPTNDGSYLTDQEVVSLVTVLNVGGNETTTNGLGNMFEVCFTHPETQAALRNDKSRIVRFVEEALRLESPVSCLPRWTSRDTTLGGVVIPAGSVVNVSYAAGNRDPSKYECPHAINMDRNGLRNHLAFGRGAHFCLGAALSRMELEKALNTILTRMNNIRLDPSAPKPTHNMNIVVRAFSALPIVFEKT